MTMPIQRQCDQYDAFNDGVRFARDRQVTDLPDGLASLVSRGPSIQAGLLNTRQSALPGPGGDMGGLYGPGRDLGRDGGPAVPESYWDGRSGEDDVNPDLEYYNPESDPQRYLPESDVAEWQGGHALPFDTPTHNPGGGYEDYDRHSPENVDERHAYNRHLASFGEARSHTGGGPAPKYAFGTMPQQQAVPMSPGHGYVPGHRVGLPWRDVVIPGTVTHLPGQQVGVRWDDGQHSTEEPSDLRPL